MKHIDNSPTTHDRYFSQPTAIYVVVASMVGSGILTSSGFVIASSHSLFGLFSLWALGGIVSLLGALAMAEMSTAIPIGGGDYNYVRTALGSAWGFIYGWSMVILGYAAPVALISYTIANYISPFLFSSEMIQSAPLLNHAIATIIVVAFTIAHCRGHHTSAQVQNLSTLFKLVVFAVMLIGLTLQGFEASWMRIESGMHVPTQWSGLAPGFILIMYAYTGWNGAVYLSGEMRNPVREVPRALIVGTSMVTVLYLLINVYYVAALDIEQVRTWTEEQHARIALIATESLFGSDMSKIIAILLSLGMLASVSAFTMTGPRILLAMGRDGLALNRLSLTCPQSGLPKQAIYAQALITLVLLWSGTFSELLEFTGFGLGVVSLLAVGVIFILRTQSGYHPTYRMWGYPWGVLVFVAVNVWMLVDSGIQNPKNAFLSLGMLGLALPVYHFGVRKTARHSGPVT